MLRLYLLAHAPTLAQRQGRFPSDEGIEPGDQAIAERIAAKTGRRDVAWSGPELRCRETAERLGVEASPCEELRAWSAGAWAGRGIGWVAERDPDGLRAWRTDPDFVPDGGESLARCLHRVSRWMQAQQQPSGRSLVIADQTVIRAALLHVLDAETKTFWRLDVAPWSLSVVQYTHGEWRLRGLSAPGNAFD